MGIDPRTKKQKVSRKECMPKPEGYVDNSDDKIDAKASFVMCR